MYLITASTLIEEDHSKMDKTEDSWLPMTSFTTKIPHWFDKMSQKQNTVNEAEMEPKMEAKLMPNFRIWLKRF